MKALMKNWLIIVLGLIILVTVYGVITSNRDKYYRELEKKLVEAAERYHTQFPERMPTGTDNFPIEQLIENGFFESADLIVKGDTCVGYIEAVKRGANVNYTAFIRCDNYTTKSFNEAHLGGS